MTTLQTVDAREALGERLVADMTATMETVAVYLGVELGLYEALATGGSATPAEISDRTGVAHRYAVEWLEQQAAAGVLAVVADDGTREGRRFELPSAHAEVLTDPTSPFYAAAGPYSMAGIFRVATRLPESYRRGTGIAYGDFGPELRRGIAGFNRPMFDHELGSSWLASVPELHERLSAAPATALDLGCGTGASSLAMARAYPRLTVVGVDLDAASVAEARAAAVAAGLQDRVSFLAGDAAELHQGDGYDLVTVFEALHDMGDPAGALRTARALLAPGGTVVVADERAAERF
ncbi:MAG TPA: class I SAM-dependent methyltransferase, partial [Jiangellales bacterium]|nr:class I SAM-dependent methyltransferase [Jiangellales bacterium]